MLNKLLTQFYPENWQATKEYIIKLTEEIEGLLIEKDEQQEQLLLNINLLVKRTNCINEVLEKNWYVEREETSEELDDLEKISQKIERLSDNIKTSNIDSGLEKLAFQLEILANLIFGVVNGQRITELVWEVRKQQNTPEEKLEIDRIIKEALSGEFQ